jgi:glycosyltransferase involved in cell wall biosynthesis
MKKLSIAIFGNTNNYPLLLAEGFIALGHHVRLLVNRKELIHRPESKHPEWKGDFPSWIFDFSEITDLDFAYDTPALDGAIAQLTHGVDLAILNDIGPAFAKYLRCQHVVFLTGSDLSYYADFDSIRLRTENWDPAFRRSVAGRRVTKKVSELVIGQRDGILSADVVSFGLRGLIPRCDRILDSIGVEDARRMMIYMSDTARLEKKPGSKNKRLRVLNGSRVLWKQAADNRYSEQDLKGADILLKGFALYCQRGGKGELRLFRKGGDVDAAVELIDSLGIANQVAWLEEMPLDRFHEEMASADIVCDQLAQSFPGMVTADAFAMGRPVLANLRNEIFGGYFPAPLPGLQASTPEEVCGHLLAVEKNRDMLQALGAQSRKFAEANLSPAKMAGMLLKKCGYLN